MYTVKFYTKNVWGNELIYLQPSEQADAINALTGQKTIHVWQMRELKKLGVEFEQVAEKTLEI